MRKRKPVEANDGSYGGRVLAAFDEMQALLAIGTRHRCAVCSAEYVCDEDGCLLGNAEACPLCRKYGLPHSTAAQNRAKHDPAWAAKLARIDARQRGNGSHLLQIVQPKTANVVEKVRA